MVFNRKWGIIKEIKPSKKSSALLMTYVFVELSCGPLANYFSLRHTTLTRTKLLL